MEEKLTQSRTSGPWTYHKDESDDGYGIAGKHPGKPDKRYTFACIQGFTIEESEATAAFIVRIANVHEELLEAAKLGAATIQILMNALNMKGGETERTRLELVQAIAKAEGV